MSLMEQELQLAEPLRNEPNWSENFCLSSFDRESGAGFWLHMGRWRKDLDLWRETLVIMRPGGEVLAHRGFGNALSAADGPGGSNIAIRVLEPGRKLTYRFAGGVRRVEAGSLRSGLVPDGPREIVVLDVEFTATAPMWDLHKVGDLQDFLGKGHVEQLGEVLGTLKVGDETTPYRGMGNRDHSMGARETSSVGSHQWIQGQFENGVGFQLYDAVLRGGADPVFTTAAVTDGGEIFDGKLTYPYRIDDPADAARDFSFSIEYERGTLEIATNGIVNTSYLSFTAPNEIYIGVYPSSPDRPLTLLEQSANYLLNGEVAGWGHIERTVPGEIEIEQ